VITRFPSLPNCYPPPPLVDPYSIEALENRTYGRVIDRGIFVERQQDSPLLHYLHQRWLTTHVLSIFGRGGAFFPVVIALHGYLPTSE
jgi:hypothetical protein